MRFSLCALSVLPLLPLSLAADESDALRRIASWEAEPERCERALLLEDLRSADVRVRSAALDFLESVTGSDFGLDPWLRPEEVPAEVSRRLEKWAAAGKGLGDAAARPTEQQLRDAVSMLYEADADTLRRICRRFERHRELLVAAIERELRRDAELPERARDNLRLAQFRVQLGAWVPDRAEALAGLLVSHVRADVIEGLEQLRAMGNVTLPIVACYVESPDVLIRETAVDIVLQLGNARAYVFLEPLLMRERERNILQIAASRAPDAAPIVAVVRFLNHCTSLEDEDVVVAALDALRDLSSYQSHQNNEPLGEGEAYRLATPADGLTAQQMRDLMARPEWRIRAAAVSLLGAYNDRAPAAESPEMCDLLFAALSDESETVRQNALMIIHVRQLMRPERASAAVQLALSRPECAPLVVCLFSSVLPSPPVPPEMEAAVRAFSPEQVDMLARLDGDLNGTFTKAPSDSSVGRLRSALLESEDAGVRERLRRWLGVDLVMFSEAWCPRLVAWLDDEKTGREERREFLASFTGVWKKYGRRGLRESVSARSLPLRDWLVRHALQEEDAQLAADSYRALSNWDPELAAEVFAQVALKLDDETLADVMVTRPDQLGRVSPEVLMELMQRVGSRGSTRLLEVLGRSEEGIRLLESSPLPAAAWYNGVVNRLRYNPSALITGWCRAALRCALAPGSSERRRAEAAMLLLAREGKDELLPETRRVAAALPEETRALLRCLDEVPAEPEQVAAWIEPKAASESASVRALAASILLPTSAWCFALLPEGQDDRLVSVFCRLASGSGELSPVDCPPELVQRVEKLQRDENPMVATLACASMLYRTGHCDTECLNRGLRYWLSRPADDDERICMATALYNVWRRWANYRSGVVDIYRLQGDVDNPDESLASSLVLLRELTGESWGVNQAVVRLIGRAGESPQQMVALRPSFSLLGEEEAPAAAPALVDAGGDPSSLTHEVPEAPASAEEGKGPRPSSEAGKGAGQGAEADGASAQPVDRSRRVRLEFFRRRDCGDCERAAALLDALRETYPQLEVTEYAIESPEGYRRNEVLCNRYQVPAAQRRKAPALFAEAGCLLGAEISALPLRDLLDASLELSARAPERQADAESSQGPAPLEPSAASPAEGSRMAATTEAEAEDVERARFIEQLVSYGVFALGGVVLLLVVVKLLLRRKGDADGSEH